MHKKNVYTRSENDDLYRSKANIETAKLQKLKHSKVRVRPKDHPYESTKYC